MNPGMIAGWVHKDGALRPLDPGEPLDAALWIDLLDPDAAALARAGELAGVAMPSRADREEIELSSRLYQDRGAAFLTVVVPAMSETPAPKLGPVTFVLGGERLFTLRHATPRPFETFPTRAGRTAFGCASAEAILLGLFEEIIDRLADILERIGRTLEGLSARVFRAQPPGRRGSGSLGRVLEAIGAQGDLVGDIGASLLSLERALGFLGQVLERRPGAEDWRGVIRTQVSDVHSISEHSGFLSQKISLMLDATLGMINIEQNATIKIFSVLAVVFLPPTLIASIYGMNFAAMPELGWSWGYPFALGLMVASAVLTWVVFRWRGWL